ncbi:hypothetical protein F3Y22_tig00110465pilonHSYRG00018 [Hibiscus syriacus]|uniref:Secreted protein n=1 Tax=Hibiscus syriacus TaxID=106335 RepID=A0A6A3AJD6_HIBSY|nr:hypothetical protein F3Y22_tig00110465pilonHSYRG00018 [Hibiscus syriacus]
MEAKLGIHVLSIFSMFFVALSNNMTVIPEQLTFGHPLCRSQIALVNFACAMVPILPIPPPSPVDGNERRSHRHKHRSRNRHRHRIHETH